MAGIIVIMALTVRPPTKISSLSQPCGDLSKDREGSRATSTLEVPAGEVKNDNELAFDIPPGLAKMLLEYRDHIAPKVVGHRPERIFVNADGTPKSQTTVAWLIKSYLRRRAAHCAHSPPVSPFEREGAARCRTRRLRDRAAIARA